MKCLSIRAPWWWWILYGNKDIENRSRNTHHRGPILLQASMFWKETEVCRDNQEARRMFLERPEFNAAYRAMSYTDIKALGGHIIGVADIVDVVPPTFNHSAHGQSTGGPWHMPGQYGWKLDHVRALKKPYLAKGMLGLFDAPASDEVKEMICARHSAEELSEGQCSKILGLDRVEIRQITDGITS